MGDIFWSMDGSGSFRPLRPSRIWMRERDRLHPMHEWILPVRSGAGLQSVQGVSRERHRCISFQHIDLVSQWYESAGCSPRRSTG